MDAVAGGAGCKTKEAETKPLLPEYLMALSSRLRTTLLSFS
jgi:hypothetical protein